MTHVGTDMIQKLELCDEDFKVAIIEMLVHETMDTETN